MHARDGTTAPGSPGDNRPWVSWPWLVASLLLVGVVASPALHLLGDPDTYWHLATGRWILAHGQVPASDSFSHTMPGAPWTAHEWLAEVVFALISRAFGWAGLVVTAAATFACTMGLLARFLLRRMMPVHALTIVGLTLGMSLSHLLVRPHVFAWLLLMLWLTELVDAVETQRRPGWWALLLVPLWANLHGSYVLGLLLAGAMAAEAVVVTPRSERRATLIRWAPFVLMALLASLLTPSGWHGWVFAYTLTHLAYALAVIQEWASPDFQHAQPLEIWLLVVLAAALSGRARLHWTRWVVVLGFVHLALKHQRNVPLAGLATAMLMARDWAASWYQTASANARETSTLDRWFAALVPPARWTVWMLAATMLGVASWTAHVHSIQPGQDNTPVKALAAARAAGAQGPVLNSYNFGGYLIHQGVPVFIDGRADMYGDPFLQTYVEAVQLKTGNSLSSLLSKYRIGWTLLTPGTPAIALLDTLPGWQRVYTDDVAVVHRRTEASAP